MKCLSSCKYAICCSVYVSVIRYNIFWTDAPAVICDISCLIQVLLPDVCPSMVWSSIRNRRVLVLLSEVYIVFHPACMFPQQLQWHMTAENLHVAVSVPLNKAAVAVSGSEWGKKAIVHRETDSPVYQCFGFAFCTQTSCQFLFIVSILLSWSDEEEGSEL